MIAFVEGTTVERPPEIAINQVESSRWIHDHLWRPETSGPPVRDVERRLLIDGTLMESLFTHHLSSQTRRVASSVPLTSYLGYCAERFRTARLVGRAPWICSAPAPKPRRDRCPAASQRPSSESRPRRGSRVLREGMRPARTSDDLPQPDVPITARKRTLASRRSSSSTCSSRPKNQRASGSSNGRSPMNGPGASTGVGGEMAMILTP